MILSKRYLSPAKNHQKRPLLDLFKSSSRVFLSVTFALGLSLGLPSQAASLDEIQTMVRTNDLPGALDGLNQYLEAKPGDRDGRFLKGIVLTELKRLPEAIDVFTALTRDEPSLPEPYNNLAVIYAAQGQFDQARAALEKAIKTHPSYAVAHENLGDLYAKLASMAYNKALELDRANVNAQTKLALIRELFGQPSKPPASEPTAADPVVPATPEHTTVVAKAEPDHQAVTTTETAETVPAPIPTPTPAVMHPALPPKAEVETTLRAWADAWSHQDVAAYLNYYSPDFNIEDHQSREAWQALRTSRLKTPKRIRVELLKIQIVFNTDGVATAKFKQHYRSDRFNNWARKTMTLRREGEAWKILTEREG